MSKSSLDKNYDFLLKVLLCGDSGVGKTCVISRYAEDQTRQSHITTIGEPLFLRAAVSTHARPFPVGIDFKLKTISLGGKRIRLQIW